MREAVVRGGCLCGALRYEASAAPIAMGYCCCVDCRKASGSGYIPFALFASAAVKISGPILAYSCKADNGADAVRNSCAVCGGLVFGGPRGGSDGYTIYAGSLDDPSWFKPTIAIFTRNLPGWVALPQELKRYEARPRA